MELLYEAEFDFALPDPVRHYQISEAIGARLSAHPRERVRALITLCIELSIATKAVGGSLRILADEEGKTVCMEVGGRELHFFQRLNEMLRFMNAEMLFCKKASATMRKITVRL